MLRLALQVAAPATVAARARIVILSECTSCDTIPFCCRYRVALSIPVQCPQGGVSFHGAMASVESWGMVTRKPVQSPGRCPS